MKRWLRIRVEVMFIRLARKILIGRNVVRAPVTNRKDNNEIWSMAERLQAIEDRILVGYKL